MADSGSFKAFEAKLQRLGAGLDGRYLKEITTRVAVATKGDAVEAAEADRHLNRSGTPGQFSGWGDPLTARFNVTGDGTFDMVPAGKTAGPWRVAESGRHPVVIGPVVPKLTKSGKTSKSQRRARRWNGVTEGFGTWSAAKKLMGDRVPGRVHDEVTRLIRKEF